MMTDFVDPPQGKSVTSQEMAARTRELDAVAPAGQAAQPGRLGARAAVPELADLPARRGGVLPARSVGSSAHDLPAYDAMLIVGGSGAMVDLANNQRLHDLILGFLRLDKPIAAECYGVACLAFARDMLRAPSIIRGKHVTGHCLEYDYQDGTGFEGPHAVDAREGLRRRYIDFGPPSYPLEFILRDAAGPDGGYHGNFGHRRVVIVDYPFITGRSTPTAS